MGRFIDALTIAQKYEVAYFNFKKVNYSGYFKEDIAGIKQGVPHTAPE